MRHRKVKGRLSRRTSYRKALLRSLAGDLFTYQRIETTMAKAKALRSFAEPLITLAKKNPGSVSARRQAMSKINDKRAVKELFDKIAPLYKDIQGGYTRIIGFGNRTGDGARMAVMELTKRTMTDDELLGLSKKEAKAKPRKMKKEAGEASGKEEKKQQDHAHAAPEVDDQTREERVVEEVKKEKAKKEQKKITKKGFFRRFQRKSMG